MKSLPFLTAEDYLWGYSASFIRLMAYDQSRVRYLSQKEIERKREEKEKAANAVFSAEDVLKQLGMGGNIGAATVQGNWLDQFTKKKDNKE